MSAGDVLAVLTVLISVGKDLYHRFEGMKRADQDILLLNTHLELLSELFGELDANTALPLSSQLVKLLALLESIQESYNKCAKVLGVNAAGTPTAPQNAANHGRSIAKRVEIMTKRVEIYARVPGILDEIRYKAEQLQKMNQMLSVSYLSEIHKYTRARHENSGVACATVESDSPPDDSLDPILHTGLASIDRMVENLMRECECLESQLQRSTLLPDTSAVQNYQAQNPEGASFWKDRFQKIPLYASALRYEIVFVSWARFVHEVETSFVLKMIPTGQCVPGDVDLLRLHGSRYSIDQNGVRRLASIRPLWIPALRAALDPLHKGYVKPEDYFNLLRDSSLSDALRKLVLESAGYGLLVECERAPGDLALPAEIESPSGHIGWIAAQIVAAPTPAELGIFTTQDSTGSRSGSIPDYISGTADGDVKVYVRYLQTGQIERKSLSKQIRPIGGISVGGAVSICHDLGCDDRAWSCDLRITQFKACQSGEYLVIACNGSTSVKFCTKPSKASSCLVLRTEDGFMVSTLPRLDYMLLGESRVFTLPPKVGEKVQVQFDGYWYNVRVTAVEGDEIEFVNWETTSKQSGIEIPPAGRKCVAEEENNDSMFFSEEEEKQLGKGTRRFWRPCHNNLDTYDVRPYRCFHIGDSIEAPVMYPDCHFRYHDIENSQLYLPARIVDTEGDQYTVAFSPVFSMHPWWPGRMAQGEKFELLPGSGVKLQNPFNGTRVVVGMDQIRPSLAGPRPVLGVQSAKPFGWDSFQGIQLCELDDLMENSLWNSDCDMD